VWLYSVEYLLPRTAVVEHLQNVDLSPLFPSFLLVACAVFYSLTLSLAAMAICITASKGQNCTCLNDPRCNQNLAYGQAIVLKS